MICKLLAIGSLAALAGSAMASTVINFDELQGFQSYAGNTYAASQGVTLEQVTSTPDALLDALLSINTVSPDFLTWAGNGAVSPDVYAYASGTNDMLFTFSQSVDRVSVDLDTYTPEGGDIVRLAALIRESDGSYRVIASQQALDDPGNPGRPANITLSVQPGQSFVYALFQSTTEQEGFDNLTFNVVPLPTGAALAGAGVLAIMTRRRRA